MIGLRNLFIGIALSILLSLPAFAAVGTIYMDTAANGSASASFSGTTDTTTPAASGTAATWTTGTAVITLDTNTSIGAAEGCTTNSTCDGSQAIFLTNATNSNQKIFWLASNSGCSGSGACTVTVTQNVTCATCTAQNWAIGGRMVLTPANYEAACRAGDTIMFNISPASSAATLVTARCSGDSTTGFVYLKGKAGVRPNLQLTGASVIIAAGAINNWWVENLELSTTSTAGLIGSLNGTNWVFNNVKFTHTSGGGSAVHINASGFITVLNSEFNISSGTGNCINNTAAMKIISTYFHGCGGDAVDANQVQPLSQFINNVFSSNARGLNFPAASTTQANGALIYANTFYANTTDGLEVADADTVITLINNIFVNDGTHANVVWSAGNAQLVGTHYNNVFYASGGTNLTGLTVNSTELTTDPKLNNPAGGDFTLQSTSPAKAAGIPGAFLGGSTIGYMDIGAVQMQATGAAAQGFIIGGGL